VYDLSPPKANQVISSDLWLLPVSFIEIPQVIHEIWCSQDLISTA